MSLSKEQISLMLGGAGRFNWVGGNLVMVQNEKTNSDDTEHDHDDGGPGSGNHGHAEVPGKVGGSAPGLSDSEEDSISYWKQGNNGWGYADIRAIANGRTAPSVKSLREAGNDEKASHNEAELEKITSDFEKAVSKCPTADQQDLVRLEAHYHIPQVGSSIEFEKYTSFSNKPNDALYDNFGIDGGVLYRVKGTTNFRDISDIGNHGTATESEVVNEKPLKFKVASVREEVVGGEETWLGIVGGHKFTVVEVEPEGKNSDGGPGSGNF